jgi:putative peptidoglycan lipid II flippase
MQLTEPSVRNKSISRNSLLLALIRIIGFIISFISVVLLANKFGAGQMSDILFIAMVFPIFFLRQIGRAVNCSFIPVFSEMLAEGDEQGAWRMTSRFTCIFLLASVLAAIFYFFSAEFFIYLLAPGFSPSAIGTIVKLTRILAPAFVLLAIFSIVESVLNSRWIFISPSFVSNLPSIGMIVGILFLTSTYGITGVVLGILFGLILQALVLLPSLREMIKTFSFDFGLKDKRVRSVLNEFIPILFGSSINQINQIADKSMSTLLGVGRVSALTYSSRLIVFLPEVFLSSFGRTILPALSEQVALKKFDETKEMLSTAFKWIFFLVLPVVTLLFILRTDIVRLFFERGNFSAENTRLTALALGCYAPSILFVTLNICVRRTLFALQESRFVARIGFIAVGFNVSMNFVLMRFIDVGGLALATTLSALLHLVASYWYMGKRIGKVHHSELVGGLLKIGIASGAMALSASLFSLLIFRFMRIDTFGMKLAHLSIVSCIAGVSYLAASWIMKVEELQKALSMVGLRTSGYRKELVS